jgi:hypothetical protein
MGKNERGCRIPKENPTSFNNTPISIRKAMLNPNENNIVSVRLSSSILRSLTNMNPGTKLKYKKPKTWRAIGRSIKITIKAINCKNVKKSRNFNFNNTDSILLSPRFQSNLKFLPRNAIVCRNTQYLLHSYAVVYL